MWIDPEVLKVAVNGILAVTVISLIVGAVLFFSVRN
jgi:hypothetical protein